MTASGSSPTPDPALVARLAARVSARGIVVFVGALTVVGALAGRAIVEGRAALRSSDALWAQGETLGAIAYALRAAEWYVPFAEHPRQAYDRLRAFALTAEQRGDGETALVAWQSIRAGVRSTTGIYAPFRSRLHEADDHLATALAKRPGSRRETETPIEQRAADLRLVFARDEVSGAPHPLAVLSMYAGLVAWFVGTSRVLAWIAQEKKYDARILGVERWIVAAVAGGIVYATSLWLA